MTDHSIRIGVDGVIVQIDETVVSKRKNYQDANEIHSNHVNVQMLFIPALHFSIQFLIETSTYKFISSVAIHDNLNHKENIIHPALLWVPKIGQHPKVKVLFN